MDTDEYLGMVAEAAALLDAGGPRALAAWIRDPDAVISELCAMRSGPSREPVDG